MRVPPYMSTHNAQALRVALIVTLVNGVASQVVTTVVGTPGVVGGYADGTGALARMNRPMNVVLGPNASFALVVGSCKLRGMLRDQQEHPSYCT